MGPSPDAQKMTLEGLRKLEYRGYDSWGIASKCNGDNIEIHKKVGKISEAEEEFLAGKECHIAIGHSRWATHGGVSECNAHPHFSSSENVAIVHNGIFENFAEIKADLIKKGYEFKSETDTEVAAMLIEENLKSSEDIVEATTKALETLKGRYAILVMNNEDDRLIVARRGSPLIIGVGKNEDEYFVASDVPAFLKHTNKVMYLDDDQMAVMNGGIKFYDLDTNEEIEKRQLLFLDQL